MIPTTPTARLTDEAIMAMMTAALRQATEMGVPQCIVIVDPSAVDLAVLRMNGAKVLSLRSARAKAQTAASTGKPSDALPETVRPAIASATQGAMTGLAGIHVGGEVGGQIALADQRLGGGNRHFAGNGELVIIQCSLSIYG